MSGKFYIYAAFRPWNGTPCYIGKGGRNDRMSTHQMRGVRHPNRLFANIFKKAQRMGQNVIFVKLRMGLSEAEALAAEMALIAAVGRKPHGPLVNRTDGGEGSSGLFHTPKSRSMMRAAQEKANNNLEILIKKSEAAKRRWKNPAYREAISASRKATHNTSEFKEKMRKKKAENYKDPALRKRISDQMNLQWQDAAYRAHMVRVHTKDKAP